MMDDARDLPVAYLTLHRADIAEYSVDLAIQANTEFDLGRDKVTDMLCVSDGTISKHHLRFHCVTYDENPVAAIEPLVYVGAARCPIAGWLPGHGADSSRRGDGAH